MDCIMIISYCGKIQLKNKDDKFNKKWAFEILEKGFVTAFIKASGKLMKVSCSTKLKGIFTTNCVICQKYFPSNSSY